MKRGDCKLFFSSNIMACKWMDQYCARSVLLLSSVFEVMNDILLVQRKKRVQRRILWFLVLRLSSFPIAAWVELILWTSVLPHIFWIKKSSVRFYLRIFFDLMDIARVNSCLNYNMKHPNKLSFLDYKVVAKNLIQYHQGWKRPAPIMRSSKTKNKPDPIHNHAGHSPDYQTMRKRGVHSAMEGKEKRTFVICLAFNILLCLVKERNCFQKYHI